MGDAQDRYAPWPSRGSAEGAPSHADISGTDKPSAAWLPDFPAPSFGPMSHHTDTGVSSLLFNWNSMVLEPMIF